MTSPLLRQAVRNNALWCDAVCSAHGAPGDFSSTLWLHRRGTPPFYPDAITLTAEDTASEQQEAIAVLVRSRDGGWGVKDSYAAIDLSSLGFKVLFEAEWISIDPVHMSEADEPLIWRQVESPIELHRWEYAWRGGESGETASIFAEPLLHNPDIVFLAAYRDGALQGGGILNRQAEVVGHSNVFAIKGRERHVRQSLVAKAGTLFPGMTLVGYESGDDLGDALELGFRSLGPLRVWVRD